MRCEEARELLQAYVDNELLPRIREEVRTHIASCSECGREAEKHARLLELLRNQPLAAPSGSFVPEVIAKVRAARTLSIRRMVLKVSAMAASLLLAVLVGYLAMTRISPTRPAMVADVKPAITAPAPDAALLNLWNSFASAWGAAPDYSEDIANGVEWLAAPITSYIHDMLTPEPDELSRTSLG